MSATGVVLAVDAGASKTDAVALSSEGALLAHGRGGPANPQLIGLAESVATIDEAVRESLGGRQVAQANLYVAGLDLPIELERFGDAIRDLAWASRTTVWENDLFAVLRAGTRAADAAAVICGTGINALAVRADGETARFPALGALSGDWGGGAELGREGLWSAARALDGRGPATVLTERIPAAVGVDRLDDVIEGIHLGALPWSTISSLSPTVLEASRDGDAVAAAIVDRQAEEIVTMAEAALRRLGIADAAVPVVVAGGVIRSGDARLLDGIRTRLADAAPAAHLEVVSAAPIVGAGILALESAGASSTAIERARAELARL